MTPKIIAFYLPQFHPIPENNKWWGMGFTEWHNVAKARPLFRGHFQPNLPGELGFYDLRLSQTRLDQAALAKAYGVYGFCYWHYWFAGKRLLETPAENMLIEKSPDFPFCLAWANESWSGVWHGAPKKILIEQTYPEGDPERHYQVLRRFFKDDRYIKHNGRPLFYIYRPRLVPSDSKYIEKLRELARADGFPDIYIVGTWSPNPSGQFQSTAELNIDAAIITNITGRDSLSKSQLYFSAFERLMHLNKTGIGLKKVRYIDAIESMLPDLTRFPFPAYNCVVSNWDNTPRSGSRGTVLLGSTPALFGIALARAVKNTRKNYKNEEQFIFLKSWNEWAEGNYVEPDQVNGRGYLEAIKSTIAFDSNKNES
ncbi:glycoside hydrolase family 99-like domain-containing protein [Polaromonas sp.]|uniref:glycosyltransferase WbsX family protein n=1 Tax=Polaromonas sp. TaxID=1869339 RepID=UPI003BB75ED3